MSSSEPEDILLPAGIPRLTQCIPSCAARIVNWSNVVSLSPDREAEFVNPAEILSHHAPEVNTLEVESMKVLKGPETLPI